MKPDAPREVAALAAERGMGVLVASSRVLAPTPIIVGGLAVSALGAVLLLLGLQDIVTDPSVTVLGIVLSAAAVPALGVLIWHTTIERRVYLFHHGLIHQFRHDLRVIRWTEVQEVELAPGKDGEPVSFAFAVAGRGSPVFELAVAEAKAVLLQERLRAAGVPVFRARGAGPGRT